MCYARRYKYVIKVVYYFVFDSLQTSKSELRKTVWGLDKTLKHYFDGQRENYDDVKKDIRTMQDFQNHQLSLLKLSLDEMAHDLTGMLILAQRIVRQNDTFFFKTIFLALESYKSKK